MGSDRASNSTASFISALVTGLVVLGALLVVWLALRKRNQAVYAPRTIFPPPDSAYAARIVAPPPLCLRRKRAPDLPTNPIQWFKTVVTTSDDVILHSQGPDTYFFMRFIRLAVMIFGPFFIVTWLILMPIAGTGAASAKGLNKFTYGNVATTQQLRLIAYFLVAILLTRKLDASRDLRTHQPAIEMLTLILRPPCLSIVYTLYLIDQEYRHYKQVRQEWLASPARANLDAARTVVISNVPEKYRSREGVQELVGETGEITNIWLSRIIGKMEDVYDERNKETAKLENAEGSVLALAAKNKRKNKLPEASKAADVEADSLIGQYIPKKKQPSHKRGFMGLLGEKVDTLNDSPAYIQEKDAELEKARAGFNELPMGDTIFVRFAMREQAHAFASSVDPATASTKDKMRVDKAVTAGKIEPRVDIMAEDVVWSNLKMAPAMRASRKILSWSLTIGLIIIWAIPVAFVGVLSNINSLSSTVPFLSFLRKIPPTVIGIIQGILPPVLLAVLFMLLPIVLRFFCKMQGTVRKSEIEKQLFVRFWLFQVIHGFLIVTVSSGLPAALKNIKTQLPQLPTLLAQKLPTASTFFLQWLALYALTSFGLAISRAVPFVMSHLGFILSGPTPRKEFKFSNKMGAIALATTWPPVALLLCVGIVYSCIQPVITLFGLFTFVLLYILYKYTLIWVVDQPNSLETGGEFMRKAMVTVFVSLYLELVCLCGLFFLATDATGKRSKPGLAGGVLMALLLALVAVFHWHTTHVRFPPHECHYLQSTTPISAGHDASVGAYPPRKESKEGYEPPQDKNVEREYQHPATYEDAPVVWICDDTLGIGAAEATRLNELKIYASTEFAKMDAEGKVHVERGPPDQPWSEGIDAI
ncbi:BZ3500_MvSof-1268-A1-R1_Chr11-3g03534 [Microbotryum saponariae]|uniref:BZ3500_MvSof-1268-A1-R1_Chr11-3g03534 protein n=1 Tax=Microbotryum saponariae TaxID=289078 RepID=A0A2X0L810_9BASI|nr:BZ3500_MvSof-1268-A1-R1_Chr11-3g03534 [Microbotryum saponariae]SDA03543.1 BZ3501_MvSof-1269-A2-R1_Chr11g03111 [Microbotryum saponariae]